MDDLTTPLLSSSGSYDKEPRYYSAINGYPLSPKNSQLDSLDCYMYTAQSNSQSMNHSVDTRTVVYKRRWYILTLFGLFSFTEGTLWNTWSPISDSSQYALNFTKIDVFLLPMWGCISYVLFMFPFAWIIHTKGLRSACVLGSFLTTLGSGLRCITSNPSSARWLIHTGQFFSNLAAPLAIGGAPALSAVWFPARERIFATAVTFIFNTMGTGVGYIIGPMFVPDVTNWITSYPANHSKSFELMDHGSLNSGKNESVVERERHYIMKFMYVEFGWAAFIFLLILIYFPSRPPTSPSVSASSRRVDFIYGAKILLKNKQFWLVALTYGVSMGGYGSWQGVLEPLLKPHNISQNTAGWLGFYAILGACAGGFIISLIAGVFSRHMKLILILLYTVGSLCQLWFTLICEEYISMPDSNVFLHISIIFGAFFINAAVPLFYETVCEITYPVAEGVTNMVLTVLNVLAGSVFLFILMIPGLGLDWMNWGVVGSLLSCIPALFLYKEKYNRLNIDENPVTAGTWQPY